MTSLKHIKALSREELLFFVKGNVRIFSRGSACRLEYPI